MDNKHFDDMRNNLHQDAQKARYMATFLEATHKTSSLAWHALADRLYEALDQADNMDQIVKPVKP